MSGAVSSHCHGHIDNLQLLDREATLLGTGKCPLYNYDSGMNRAARTKRQLNIRLTPFCSTSACLAQRAVGAGLLGAAGALA